MTKIGSDSAQISLAFSARLSSAGKGLVSHTTRGRLICHCYMARARFLRAKGIDFGTSDSCGSGIKTLINGDVDISTVGKIIVRGARAAGQDSQFDLQRDHFHASPEILPPHAKREQWSESFGATGDLAPRVALQAVGWIQPPNVTSHFGIGHERMRFASRHGPRTHSRGRSITDEKRRYRELSTPQSITAPDHGLATTKDKIRKTRAGHAWCGGFSARPAP